MNVWSTQSGVCKRKTSSFNFLQPLLKLPLQREDRNGRLWCVQRKKKESPYSTEIKFVF